MKTQIFRKHVKLVAVMTLSLLCSHLWAQGSEGAGQWFTIKLADEAKTTAKFQLITENGSHKIKSGLIPSEKSIGYTAFFVSDDNKYFIYEYSEKKKIYNAWAEADEKDKADLTKIYSYVNNLNLQVLSDDCETYLTNVGYKEINKNDLNVEHYRNKNKGFDKMSIYNKTNGTFVLAIFTNSDDKKVKILSFKDTKSFASLYINDKNLLDNFFIWLEKNNEEKKLDENLKIYKKVAQLIYDSLYDSSKRSDRGKYKFYHLYDSDSNIPIRRYIQLASNINKNVFLTNPSNDDGKKYISITKNEGKKIVNLIEAEIKKESSKNKTCNIQFIDFLKDILVNAKIWNTTNLDIENQSIVISDVQKAVKGDFILYGDYGIKDHGDGSNVLNDIYYAVIINDSECKESFDKDQTNGLGELLVAYLNDQNSKIEIKKFSQLWQNDKEVPECVEIRRLLKESKSTDIETNNNITWDLFNSPIDPSSLKIEIGGMKESKQNGGATKYRWIPNTGEYLNLEKISLTAYNLIGLPIKNGDWTIILDGAIDRGWDANKNNLSKYGNIFNNSNCKFEIKIEGDDNTKTYLSKDDEENLNRYNCDENKIVLTIKGDDKYLSYNNKPAVIQIRPENANSAHPGDDLLLSFKILCNNEINDTVIIMQEKDYIAVYDKKMVWRANLYIQESKNDWNDIHPWNAPPSKDNVTNTWGDESDDSVNNNIYYSAWNGDDWGYNEWNRTYNFAKLKGAYDLTKLDNGNGTQSNIIPNNSTYAYNFEDTKNYAFTKDAVAYDWEGQDSPFLYNFKTDSQKKILSQFYFATGDFMGSIYVNNVCTKPANPMQVGYDYNTAPKKGTVNSYYPYYLHSESKYTTNALNSNVKLISDARKISGESIIINNVTYYPYVGSLTNSITEQFSASQGSAPSVLTGYTAGTDCVSFCQRSAGYNENNYTWAELKDSLWGSSWDESQTYPYWDGDGILITKKESAIIDNIDGHEVSYWEDMKNVVPGDVMYYVTKTTTSDGSYKGRNGAHCFMVADIESDSNNYDDENILIIESTNGSKFGNIKKSNHLNDYSNRRWFIVRLKKN